MFRFVPDIPVMGIMVYSGIFLAGIFTPHPLATNLPKSITCQVPRNGVAWAISSMDEIICFGLLFAIHFH
jgi:hypothetical protein